MRTRIVSFTNIVSIRRTIPKSTTLVLVTGVFDLLHREHRRLLRAAQKEGKVLIVGIEPDKRVRAIKGEGRPLYTARQRLTNLARLGITSYVFALPGTLGTRQGRERLIARLKPDVLAISAHTPHLAEKRRVLAKFGGRVKIVLPHNPRISTSRLLARRKKFR